MLEIVASCGVILQRNGCDDVIVVCVAAAVCCSHVANTKTSSKFKVRMNRTSVVLFLSAAEWTEGNVETQRMTSSTSLGIFFLHFSTMIFCSEKIIFS